MVILSSMHGCKLTLFGRSLFLVVAEFTANAALWITAAILFGRDPETRSILTLALLAWTLGLRHALDADHIRFKPAPYHIAIDNATRGLINLGQLPVTCGLFFSLGHSTIVVVVTVAIAISSDVYNKINGVSTVGGIVGAAVSGSFLFIIGFANSVILWRIIKRRRQEKKRDATSAEAESNVAETQHNPKHDHMIMMRILGPVVAFVNRPWKMYPVGVLFGFGFDTASSIALLAVSASAKRESDGRSIPSAQIVILPLLFTAGMSLIDSMDSILMLYSYSGFPEHSWALFEKSSTLNPNLEEKKSSEGVDHIPALNVDDEPLNSTEVIRPEIHPGVTYAPTNGTKGEQLPNDAKTVPPRGETIRVTDLEARISRDTRVKMNVMSGLSIILTLLSILVAFSISLITIMGLIGEQCGKCREAAEAEDGGGLAGSWWRGWAKANDNSGYIGAAIVGGFVAIVIGWYGTQWGAAKLKKRNDTNKETTI